MVHRPAALRMPVEVEEDPYRVTAGVSPVITA
jgi:hypothetical protein